MRAGRLRRYALLWCAAGVLLLVISWWRDPALVAYFMIGVPAWAAFGLVGAVVLTIRGASPLPLLLPLAAIGSCSPAATAHLHWYRGQADKTLLEFMAAEAEGRTDARVAVGRALTRLAEDDRRQVAEAITSRQCPVTHRDEFFGSQETTLRCFDTLGVYVDMREGPIDRWRFDVFFTGTDRVIR
jgi:hypothetical protein